MVELPPVFTFLLAEDWVEPLNAGIKFAPARFALYRARFTATDALAKSLLFTNACLPHDLIVNHCKAPTSFLLH